MSTKFNFTSLHDGSWTDKQIEHGSFHIPNEIADAPQWITYKKEWDEDKGGYSKKPHATELSKSDYGGYWVKWAGVRSPEQFTDYLSALDFVEETNRRDDVSTNLDGVGFVFTEEDDFIGVDLDDCVRDDGTIKQFVNTFLGSVDSFSEFSQSGTGVHIIAKGNVSDKYKQRNDELGVEIYDEGRFFCTTGDTIRGTRGAIRDATDEIHLLQEKYMDERQQQCDSSEFSFDSSDDGSAEVDDASVVRTAKAHSREFERLYEGANPKDSNGGSNASDLSFCNKLAFYTKDENQIERIWKNSGRARAKLDRDDYVRDTIRKALRSNTAEFSGNYK